MDGPSTSAEALANPTSVPVPGPSQSDVISAREQRSHIAIIQMAPPAPKPSSSSAVAPAAPTGAGTREGKNTERVSHQQQQRTTGDSGRGAVPKKKRRHHCSVQGCTYNTAHTKDLTRHMRKHTGEKPFNCDRCSKSFTRYDKLVMHIRIHEGHKRFSCQFCDYAAIDSSSLKKHLRTHSNERPYKCTLCPYSCKDSSQLIVHIRRHTGDSPYLCTFTGCEAAFKTPSDLNRHTRLHTGEKPFKCLYCDYRAAVKSNLNSHMKRHSTTPNSKLKGRGKKLAAIDGSENGDNDDDIVAKTVVTTSTSQLNLPFQYACKICDNKFDTITLFSLHMEESHSNNKTTKRGSSSSAPESSLNYQCSSCHAAFTSEESLRVHMRQHGTIPNKPANVDPGIYSPGHHQRQQRYSQNPYHYQQEQPDPYRPPTPPAPPLPPHYERDRDHETDTEVNNAAYTLHEMQRMPLVHSTVIAPNPTVIANGGGGSNGARGGNIIQHHHYDPNTGHMYVITYNNLPPDEDDQETDFNVNP